MLTQRQPVCHSGLQERCAGQDEQKKEVVDDVELVLARAGTQTLAMGKGKLLVKASVKWTLFG